MLTVVAQCRHSNMFHRRCSQLLRITTRRVTYKGRKKYKQLKLLQEQEAIFDIWETETTRIFGPVLETKNPLNYFNPAQNPWKEVDNPPPSHNPARNSNIHYAPSTIPLHHKGGSTLQEVAASNFSTTSTTTSPKNLLIQTLNPILNYPLFGSKDSKVTPPEVRLDGMVEGLTPRLAMPSVSRVLEISRSPEEQAVLDRWKAKMIKELGEEGFQKWQKGTSFVLEPTSATCIVSPLLFTCTVACQLN